MNISRKLAIDFWDEDKKNGSIIRNQYDEIKQILNHYDRTWIENQLIKIKKHSIEHTEFYKKYNIDDIFPVVNKTFILDNYDAMLADSGFELPTHISSTSGSTGTPFKVVQDMKKRKRTIADLQIMGELAEYNSHERMVFFRVLHQNSRRSAEQENKENIYYIDCSDLSSVGLNNMYCELTEKKPVCIMSYTSTLVELAKYIIQSSYAKIPLKSIITIGEGVSEENHRLLTEAFDGKVYRRYSDMELGILAQDNGNRGEYRLNWGSFYFECLKLNSDEPAEENETGRIVITDLFNYALPMIRYDTGDLGVMGHNSLGIPVLKEIHGRERDCIYSASGELVSPAKISVSMWGIDSIKQWQFIQNTKTGYTLKLNADINNDYSDIIKTLKSVLGENANIDMEFVDDIPVLSSNKRRAVINNYIK